MPVVWLWVNSHGSFPLGLAWLGARAVGEALDWRAWPRETLAVRRRLRRRLGRLIVNPLGPRLLAFPLTLGEKSESFSNIVEWRSPDFSRAGGYFALAFLALALVLLVRARLHLARRRAGRSAFVAASLLASRNIGPLAVVLAPVLGRALRRPESGTEASRRRRRQRPDEPGGAGRDRARPSSSSARPSSPPTRSTSVAYPGAGR